MTSLRSASTARRRRAVAAVGAVGAGLLVLSACDKPTPISTVTVGTSSVSSEASCYSDDDGKALQSAEVTECLKKDTAKDADVKTIKVDPDENVRFGVDPEIADKGWTILLNGNPLTGLQHQDVPHDPRQRVLQRPVRRTRADSTLVSIKEGENDVKGVWSFRLKKDS